MYTIRKVLHSPGLNGDWNSPEWSRAETGLIAHFHPKSSEHRPVTRTKVLYDADKLYVAFHVADRYVLATRTRYQEPVYRDACVEFFVQPKPSAGYFNFEMNCLGTLLLSYVEDPTRTAAGLAKATKVPEELASRMVIYHSVSDPLTAEAPDLMEWTVQYSIPFALFEAYTGPLGDVSRQEWRGNFYKCAEDNSHPHWASWAPISDELNFHRPDRFDVLRFAE